MMKCLIGNASIDERKKAKGGLAGDQTGREVKIQEWYSYPWIAVIRPKDRGIAEKIAQTMESACKNDNIGYDQSQRTTLFDLAEKVNFDLSKIKTKCETDCSALVSVCVNAAGIKISKHIYTGNELETLNKTGKFEILRNSKYLYKSVYLERGDILLGKGHTAVVITIKNSENKVINETKVRVTANALNVREKPNTNSKILTVIRDKGIYDIIAESNGIGATKWGKLKSGAGWISLDYVKKV